MVRTGTIDQNGPTCHGVLRCAQLLPQFVHVVRVDLLIQGAAKPLGLGLVQNRGHRVRHINHPSCFCRHHEQEAVRRLQDEVLQLLQGTENRERKTAPEPDPSGSGTDPSRCETDPQSVEQIY